MMSSTADVISDDALSFNDEHISEHISLVLDREVMTVTDEQDEGCDDLTTGSTTITVSSDFSPLVTSSSGAPQTISPAVTALTNSPLMLTQDSLSNQLTVCQYIIPADIITVNGIGEVVQEVELVKHWNLNSPTLASTSDGSTESLQLLSSTAGQEDVLFTVVDDGSTPPSVIHLDASTTKTGLEAVTFPSDLIIEKYYQYGDDVRLVEDVEIEDVDLNSTALDACITKEEIFEDPQLSDEDSIRSTATLELPHLEGKKLSDFVSGQVMMTQDCLESLKTESSDSSTISYVTATANDVISNGLSNNSDHSNTNLCSDFVLSYIDEGQPGGKTVCLKVHKVPCSDRNSKLTSHKLLGSAISSKQDIFRCKECNVYFKRNDELKAHMEAHLVKKQNSCALCNVEFPSKSALQSHIKQHFSKAHACDLCSEKFASKGLLRTHKLRRHGNSVSTFTSSNLETKVAPVSSEVQTVTSNNTSLAHQPTVYSNAKNSAVAAAVTNTNNPSISAPTTTSYIKVFKCSLCEAVYSSRTALKQHSTSHHQKPYKCDQCGATFTQNGSLQVHIRRHRGEKPFTCKLCGNSYTRAFSLKVHMKTHTGEKPHMCEYCSSSFITSSHLNVHRRIHTGERPFSCTECSATFITTSHLNVHKKIHLLSGVTPVRCHHCNQTFKDSTQLRLHRKLQHPNANTKKRRGNHASTCKCKECHKAISELNKFLKDGTIVNKIGK